MPGFAEPVPGLNYLTEGGQETEIMYKYGFELPEFAMFPLLDQPAAVTELRGMYTRYLDTAAHHGFGALMGGFDYRASPDWASLIGYSSEALEDLQLRAIEFLRELGEPYRNDLPALMYVGIVGPRGDAYSLNQRITAEDAEEYHSTQIATLARAEVDLVEAMTFNSVPEAVGVAAPPPAPDLRRQSRSLSTATIASTPVRVCSRPSSRSTSWPATTDRPSMASIARTHSSSSRPSSRVSGSRECDASGPTRR